MRCVVTPALCQGQPAQTLASRRAWRVSVEPLMKFHLRTLFLGSAGLLLSCTDSSSTAPPNNPASSEKIQPLTASVVLGVTPLAVDKHGVPNLLRGGDDMPRMAGASATEVARMHLARLSSAWGVPSAKMPPLDALGEIAVRGGT